MPKETSTPSGLRAWRDEEGASEIGGELAQRGAANRSKNNSRINAFRFIGAHWDQAGDRPRCALTLPGNAGTNKDLQPFPIVIGRLAEKVKSIRLEKGLDTLFQARV
jgi:hypothetical protein